MAKISLLIKLLKLNNYHSHFAVELLLVIITVIAASGNLMLKANLGAVNPANKSLLFAYLAESPDLNEKLYNSLETINLELAADRMVLEKQVLAASVKADETAGANEALLPTLSGSALLKPNPAGNGALLKKDIETYEVKGGDTIAQIAGVYGVSEDTIITENNLSGSIIKPGQELRILPTTGVKHVIKDGETLDMISKKYGVDLEDILEYNEIEIEDHIFPGEEIIVPNAVVKKTPTPQRRQYVADLQKEDYKKVEVPDDYQPALGANSDFIWPIPAARRLSQSFWSKHRAIDVPCRDCQVVAAGGGIVEIAGWQKGYGYTILINHGNGYKTRYGHASKLLVTAGEAVAQGQAIMVSGSTGRATGPHLHFEIRKDSSYLDPMKNL